jgi:hypothetical protein
MLCIEVEIRWGTWRMKLRLFISLGPALPAAAGWSQDVPARSFGTSTSLTTLAPRPSAMYKPRMSHGTRPASLFAHASACGQLRAPFLGLLLLRLISP